MRLWTIQSYEAYERLLEKKVLTADEDYLFCGEDLRFAYDWMAEQMRSAGLVPAQGERYPIWAWYQWEGERKRCDMRRSGYAMPGERIVLLTIEVDDPEVLLSDFDLYHYVLNYWYLPEDDRDSRGYDEELLQSGHEWTDPGDPAIQGETIAQIRKKITNSWQRIFDLEREDNNRIYGKNSSKSIQATFWQLKLEQVVEAEIFTAR